MSELKLKVPFKAPLNKVDTENQTWDAERIIQISAETMD